MDKRIGFHRDGLVWGIAALTAVVHLAVAGQYDILRNELYFIACGFHPAFGYVDQPPLVPLLAAATQSLGVNVWLLRLPAALAAVALVPLTAAFVRLLGGGTKAVVLAAAAVALAPGLAALTATLTTSTFEPLAWTTCAYLVARAHLRDDRRALMWAGFIAGISMEAKYGIAIWLLGLAGGVLATSARRIVTWRHCWMAVALSAAVALPSFIWQTGQGWPFFTVIFSPLTAGAKFNGTPIRFAIGQAMAMNALLAPLWLAGVFLPFTGGRLKSVRFLPIAFAIAAIIDFTSGGKGYYLYPVYPTLFAVGAAALAGLGRLSVGLWMMAATAISVAMAPVVLPILSPASLDRYLNRTHLRPPPIEAAAIGAPLTIVFSDELGWRAMEKDVAAIYQALPDAERQRAAIMAGNYGEAAAIDVYGRADGLPPALSGHNQYFLWGPQGFDGSVIIHVGGDMERWRPICDSIESAGTFGAPYAMPFENNRPIFICRGLRGGLTEAWPHFKRYQ